MISFWSILNEAQFKVFEGSRLSVGSNANKERRQLKFHGSRAPDTHPGGPGLFISVGINIQDEVITGLGWIKHTDTLPGGDMNAFKEQDRMCNRW